MTQRKRISMERWKVFNHFVDRGLAKLSRSEGFVYLILFRDTRPTGLARTALSELAQRGGMSERQASRALQSLIRKGKVYVIRAATGRRAALYSLYPPSTLAEINPGLKSWIDGTAEPPDTE